MAPDPQYKNSLTTFIDILGFRNLVGTRPGAEVKNIIDQLHYIGDVDADDRPGAIGKQSDLGLYVTAFSDSVVRVQAAGQPGGLFHELLAIVHMQAALVYQGVFLRGGVAFGTMFAEDKVLFGDGLIQAYDLESKGACNPRILVDGTVLAALHNGNAKSRHAAPEERAYIDDLIAEDEDGKHFIDYLRAYKTELDEPNYDYPEFLNEHKDAIQAEHAAAAGNRRVQEKYEWLARYHNKVVAEIGCEHEGLLVSSLENARRPRRDRFFDAACRFGSRWLGLTCRRPAPPQRSEDAETRP